MMKKMLLMLMFSLLIDVQAMSLKPVPVINLQPTSVSYNKKISPQISFTVPISDIGTTQHKTLQVNINEGKTSELPIRGLNTVSYDKNKNEIFPLSVKSGNYFDQTVAPKFNSPVTIWEMVNNEMLQADIMDYRDFESTSSYIVCVQKTSAEEALNMDPNNWDVYYWIGKHSACRDVSNTAVKAVELDYQIHSTTRIRREIERHESSAFKAIFKEEERPGVTRIINTETLNEDVNHINSKRMFVIEGRHRLTLKTADLSLDEVIKNDKKCFVIIGKRIHVFCGTAASELQKEAAEELSKIILQKVVPDFQEETVIIDRKYGPPMYHSFDEFNKLLDFYEEIARIPEEDGNNDDNNSLKFTSTELRRVLHQTEIQNNGVERFNIGLTKIYKSIVGIRSVPKWYANQEIKSLNTQDCYLIDSRSHAGLFVLMGSNSKIDVRMASAKKAELYRMKKGYHYTMPIIFVDENDIPPKIQSFQDIIHTFKYENEENVS